MNMRIATLPLFFGCALLSGCLSTGLSEAEPSADAVFLELPRVDQEEANRCGVVSLAILCAYHGVDLPLEEQFRLGRRAQSAEGLSGAELLTALESTSLKSALFSGTTADLHRHLDAGRPALVMISLDGEQHHYCLVNGYEPESDLLYLVDPRRGQVAAKTARFEEMWERSRHFTLVAAPDLVATAGSSPELEELRAGDISLSDRELAIIGLTVLGVLILILIF